MQPEQLYRTYLDLTTPHVADACMRLGIAVRCAPAGTVPLWEGTHMVGRATPARHFGSVDVFLEAIERADPGDVLVVDVDNIIEIPSDCTCPLHSVLIRALSPR